MKEAVIWITTSIIWVSWVFIIVGSATTEYRVGPSGYSSCTTTLGVWKGCWCKPAGAGFVVKICGNIVNPGSVLKAAQAFSIIGLLAIFVTLIAMYFVSAAISGAVGILAFIITLVSWSCATAYYDYDEFGSWGYSMGLFTSGTFSLLVCSVAHMIFSPKQG